MMRTGHALAFFFAAVTIAACGSGVSHLPAQPVTSSAPSSGATTSPPTTKTSSTPTVTPTTTPTPTATPTIGPNGLTTDQVNSTLQSTQSFYATLPHTSVISDLQAVAKQMVASGAYTSAVVTPGGITGTLPDGSTALVFADEPEELQGSASAAAARRRSRATVPAASRVTFDSAAAPVAHEYVFLYNDTDPDFNSNFDKLWSSAFRNVPFTGPSPAAANSQYGLLAGPITLDNITAFSTGGHPIDFLNMTTHGMVATTSLATSAPSAYYLLSTTPINPQTRTQYMSDYLAKNIVYGVYLSIDNTTPANNAGQFAFSPAFLTSHVQFNQGAVVNLAACFGQSPTIASSVGAVFQNAHVGRYYGWTKAVGITDDYQSMSFLYDRLLGEQNPTVTGFDKVAAQRTPAQRPFSLDEVYGIMQNEMRSSVIEPAKNQSYAVSDVMFAPNATVEPLGDGTAAKYLVTDFNAEGMAGAPIVYGFPSISTLSIAESSTSGTLTIAGEFPPDTGTAQITDSSGTTPLTVTAWSPTSVTALLPASGNGSSGMVTVLSATGVPSNPVPLTQWTGFLTYTENDQIPDLDGTSGGGSGTLSAQLNIQFRADVHPVVPLIDASPVPQPFVFSFSEGSSPAQPTSFGQLTSYNGSYTSTSESTAHTATFALESPAPFLYPATPPLQDNTFEVRSYAGQPAPCNSGDKSTTGTVSTMVDPNVFCPLVGFVADASQIICTDDDSGDKSTTGTVSTMVDPNVFCPLVGFVADASQIICTDDDSGALCEDNGYAGFVAYSGPFDAMGLLSFTLDPATYNISVAGTMSNFTSAQFYDDDRPATASMSGTISGPSYAPTAMTPALKIRRAFPARIHRASLGQIGPDEAKTAAARRSRNRSRRGRR